MVGLSGSMQMDRPGQSPKRKPRYTNDWQEDRAVAAGAWETGFPGEESPNSVGQCAG